jgi:regulator of replication initiation timing
MKLSEIVANLKALADKVTGVQAEVADLKPKATNPKPITDEERTAFNAKIAGLEASITDLQTGLSAATTAITEATTANTTLTAENTSLKTQLADKKAIATAGVAAAAELAANQTTTAVSAKTDVDASGKTPEQVLRAKLDTATTPREKTVIARELRALRGVSFVSQEVKAAA